MLKSLEGTEMELETTPDTSVPPSRGESQCRLVESIELIKNLFVFDLSEVERGLSTSESIAV